MTHPVWKEQWAFMSLEDRLVGTGQFLESLDRHNGDYEGMGWVYAMVNPAVRDRVFKIGRTSRWPWERAGELTNGSGVYGEFFPVYFVHVGDRVVAERHVQKLLSRFRAKQGKEFFEAPLPGLLDALDEVGARWPVWVGDEELQVLPQPFMSFVHHCDKCGASTMIRELLLPVRARCRECNAELDAA